MDGQPVPRVLLDNDRPTDPGPHHIQAHQAGVGSAEEIAQRLSESGPGEADRSRHLAFGDLAAVWGVLDRLGIRDIIDEVVGSRRSDAAASVGTYIALATLNRVVATCSKLALADWWATTAGDRVVGRFVYRGR